MRTPFQCRFHIFRLGKFRTHLFEAICHHANSIRIRFLFDASDFDKLHCSFDLEIDMSHVPQSNRDGWRDRGNCENCVENYQNCVGSKCGCSYTDNCSCRICVRQHPTLFNSALHVYTKMVHNLTDFELNCDTTYEQYTYAVDSIEVDMKNLLPPEFPEVRIWFRYNTPHYERKYHRDCLGTGVWHSETCHTFSNVFAAIDNLANEEETFWSHFCHRGLFFPNSCPDDDLYLYLFLQPFMAKTQQKKLK